MVNNKLQVAMNLVKKKWKGDVKCFLCGCAESVDHVFFQCHLAKLVRSIIREVYQLEKAPTSLDEFTSTWLMGKGPLPIRLIIFFFAGFSRTLWTTRNKMAIEKEILKSPTDAVYTAQMEHQIEGEISGALPSEKGLHHELAQRFQAYRRSDV